MGLTESTQRTSLRGQSAPPCLKLHLLVLLKSHPGQTLLQDEYNNYKLRNLFSVWIPMALMHIKVRRYLIIADSS